MGDLLDQRFHVFTSTQELLHWNAKIREASRGLPGRGEPNIFFTGKWPPHVDRFEKQYDKAFVRYPLFGADLMDRIHKRVQFFLHSCNTTTIGDVESGGLVEFGELQKKVEIG